MCGKGWSSQPASTGYDTVNFFAETASIHTGTTHRVLNKVRAVLCYFVRIYRKREMRSDEMECFSFFLIIIIFFFSFLFFSFLSVWWDAGGLFVYPWPV